ncbi:MAG: 6-carboxytetrahydropterin synthase [Deltaproteobacteria bacterium]|jgi:6-pyruvoyltetrahydropterin/6-carboxytetrahydropterin synthase|nr:6-carboxytetrahydropterin synthase [Deltaproteobacteria bacterium]
MFRVNVARSFQASHALKNYNCADETPHEHIWKFEICVASKSLDESGCAVDFVKLDKLIDEIIHPFEGSSFNCIKPFDEISPSTENIAKFIFDRIATVIDSVDTKLSSVTVWEDIDHSATYYE